MSNPARQRTVSSRLEFSGVGLHSGEECRINLCPAPQGEGVVFQRADLPAADAIITAKPDSVVRARHGTCLSNSAGASVATVEHLLAALALTGVDNALIEVEGPEIPIMDGSAAAFVAAIADAGVTQQAALREPFVIDAPFDIVDGDRSIRFEPFDGQRIEIEIDFGDCMIGHQILSLDLGNPEDLVKLSAARTFIRLSEVEALREAGLARGGALSNAIVVDGDQVLNDEPLRDPAEFALHKALDLVGDLYLAGAPVVGRIRAVKPGHELNTRAAAALMARAGADLGSVRASA
ncbi:MAG: UDP-3-O-acyl-N-acetylglucosamine deacetylase [Pseudomonadota bacterium]